MNKSGTILKEMGKLMNLTDIKKNCTQFAKQMMKAGIIEEMVNDTFEELDDPDTEKLADKEVDKIIYEITQGQLGGVQEIKNKGVKKEEKIDEKQVEQKDKDIDEMKARLEQLNA
eukprot:CAMPEP_0167757696 /NCGR_PEP_ID=MMETSP0110_2-20121227/10066_1 /TAXON_ID=629695 /ORGANISM="Gymnochlora sp., Strain CCMP2014" /LENGTH=114 /DNA_ID=CAMNT_0007643909 /DNA_START=284 /DNA_END=628 /DNA_ORIENTATION=+